MQPAGYLRRARCLTAKTAGVSPSFRSGVPQAANSPSLRSDYCYRRRHSIQGEREKEKTGLAVKWSAKFKLCYARRLLRVYLVHNKSNCARQQCVYLTAAQYSLKGDALFVWPPGNGISQTRLTLSELFIGKGKYSLSRVGRRYVRRRTLLGRLQIDEPAN
jgi:hypothetical protein